MGAGTVAETSEVLLDVSVFASGFVQSGEEMEVDGTEIRFESCEDSLVKFIKLAKFRASLRDMFSDWIWRDTNSQLSCGVDLFVPSINILYEFE